MEYGGRRESTEWRGVESIKQSRENGVRTIGWEKVINVQIIISIL
jgi:hypothetical protein